MYLNNNMPEYTLSISTFLVKKNDLVWHILTPYVQFVKFLYLVQRYIYFISFYAVILPSESLEL